MMVGVAVTAIVVAYLTFVCVSIGLPERLRLAFGRLSIDRIADRAARRHGDRVLFTTDEPCAWSVPQLRDRPGDPSEWSATRIRATADHVAALLRHELRLPHGARVAILKRNHLDMHVLAVGVVRAGGVACPINGNFAASKLNHYLLNVGAHVLFTDVPTLGRILREGGAIGDVAHVVLATGRAAVPEAESRELLDAVGARHPQVAVHWIEDALARVEPDGVPVRRGKREPLYLVHSSGTTGFPKAVILVHGRQVRAMRAWLCYVHVSRRRDKGYLAVPNNHQAVILTFNCLLSMGVRVHWTRATGRDTDASRIATELADGGYTGFFAFPIVYTKLKPVLERGQGHDLRGMRFWASTADAAHEEMIKPCVAVGSVFRRLGIPVGGSVYLDAQGSSEVGTPSVLRYYTRFTKRYERRIGRRRSAPFPPRIRLTRDGEVLKGRGTVGRLEVRGKTVFPAYWNNHTLTYEAIRDEWFFTGDVARFSRDRHLVQLDREVDVIRTSAGEVYSLPIEEKVHKHRAVFDACVYGARQPDGTQLPAAAIALHRGVEVDAEQLRAELNAMLAPSEQLVRLDVMDWDDFPIGITGKTLKRVFRERTEPQPVAEANRPIALELLERPEVWMPIAAQVAGAAGSTDPAAAKELELTSTSPAEGH